MVRVLLLGRTGRGSFCEHWQVRNRISRDLKDEVYTSTGADRGSPLNVMVVVAVVVVVWAVDVFAVAENNDDVRVVDVSSFIFFFRSEVTLCG